MRPWPRPAVRNGCTCPGPRGVRQLQWRVEAYRCNYSAFNGYHQTDSDYSAVLCLRCRARWRTKAAYIEELTHS